MAPPLRRVSIQGYRAARELELTPGSVCALVGEASSGKSTVLTAIWTLLEAAAPPPTIDDIARDGAGGRIRLEADVAKGTIFLDARPPDTLNLNRAGAPPVLFLPANLRSRTLVAPATGRGAAEVAELFQPPAVDHHWAAADGGLALVAGMEQLLASNLRHFVLLIEEPELYLSPHGQRQLYGLLRALAQAGNQILYSTHAPVFLSVDKLEELALARHTPAGGTSLFQPQPLAEAEMFRALSEFDSDRAELFLARCAVLVEGRTEKLTFPLVFDALGSIPTRKGSSSSSAAARGTCRSSRASATRAASPTSSSTTATRRVVSRPSSRSASSIDRSARLPAVGAPSSSRRTSRRCPGSRRATVAGSRRRHGSATAATARCLRNFASQSKSC